MSALFFPAVLLSAAKTLGLGKHANSLLNGFTGAALTGAQNEANEFSAQQASIDRQFQSEEATKARQFQLDFYNQFQSPQAMVSQYKAAGINPAMVANYGGGSSISPPMASGDSASSVQPTQSSGLIQMLSALTSVADLKSQMKLRGAQAKDLNASATLKESQTIAQNTNNKYIEAMNNLSIESKRTEIEANLQSVKESISRVKVNDSTIDLNDIKIKLYGSEADLNAVKYAVENINLEKANISLRYFDEVQQANLDFTRASSNAQRAYAAQALSDAKLNALYHMKEDGLIEQGYYDTMVKQAKRDFKWTPINNLIKNVGTVVLGAAGVASAGASISNAVTNAAKAAHRSSNSFMFHD